jgi:hypothetical protein
MVRLIGIPGDKDNGSDMPASWINPKHIVHDVPLPSDLSSKSISSDNPSFAPISEPTTTWAK